MDREGGNEKEKGRGAEGQLFIKAKRQGQARSEKELYAGVRLRGLSMKILVVLWASTIRERTDDGIRDERREWLVRSELDPEPTGAIKHATSRMPCT